MSMNWGRGVWLAVWICFTTSLSFGQGKLKPLALLKHEENLLFHDAVFSPEGNRLISVGNQGMLYLWDATKSYPVSFKQVHKGTALACAYSQDGKYIITGGEEKSIKVLLSHDLSVVKTIFGLPARVREIAMTGNRLVALLQNNEIQIYNTDSWEKVGKPRYAAKDSKIVFSNKGDRFYAWFSSRIYSISAKDGELIKVFNTNYATPTDLALSTNDSLLAVGFGQADEVLRIFNTADFKQVKGVKKSGAGDYVTGMSFFHNSNKLLYLSNTGNTNLKVYDLDKDTHTTVSKGSSFAKTSISRDNSKVLLAPKGLNSIRLMAFM